MHPPAIAHRDTVKQFNDPQNASKVTEPFDPCSGACFTRGYAFWSWPHQVRMQKTPPRNYMCFYAIKKNWGRRLKQLVRVTWCNGADLQEFLQGEHLRDTCRVYLGRDTFSCRYLVLQGLQQMRRSISAKFLQHDFPQDVTCIEWTQISSKEI